MGERFWAHLIDRSQRFFSLDEVHAAIVSLGFLTAEAFRCNTDQWTPPAAEGFERTKTFPLSLEDPSPGVLDDIAHYSEIPEASYEGSVPIPKDGWNMRGCAHLAEGT